MGARGRFGDKAKPYALTIDSTHARVGAYGVALALVTGIGLLGFAAGRRR